jgi:arabinoxylan arabinofuranohydrolase
MKAHFLVIFCFLFDADAWTQNPVVPPGIYFADPSARIGEDGRLYLYGSVDESVDYYCSWRYHILSSNNLIHWKIHRNTFASKGEGDQVPYNDDLLYAPDCRQKGDTFFLYYCQPGQEMTEGVATSLHPAGPFVNGRRMYLKGYNEIDPSVFVDEDGQAYYVWGQISAKMARLSDDMRQIDTTSIMDSILTESEHFFHEGAFMLKRNGIYYLVYTDIGRAGMATCIGYSTSRSPMGPYRYGGVIIDNDHCDPGNWNNHGSIVEFSGNWYVFYQRSTNGSKYMRKACIEPIRFENDGSIPEVEMTSQGVLASLPAMARIDAGRACLLYGNVRIQGFGENSEELGDIRDGDRAAFKYLDFGKGADSIRIHLRPGQDPGSVSFRLDMPWGPSIGEIEVPSGGEEKARMTRTALAGKVRGIHALWLVFSGEGENLYSVDWDRIYEQ